MKKKRKTSVKGYRYKKMDTPLCCVRKCSFLSLPKNNCRVRYDDNGDAVQSSRSGSRSKTFNHFQ